MYVRVSRLVSELQKACSLSLVITRSSDVCCR